MQPIAPTQRRPGRTPAGRRRPAARPRQPTGIRTLGRGLLLLLVSFPCVTSDLAAQNQPQDDEEAREEREVEWRNTSEVSYLVSGGNSAVSTLGLRNTLRRRSSAGDLRADVVLLRTDAVRVDRYAVGSVNDFRLEEDRETERTTERYTAEARYDLNLGSRAFATASLGWQRNTFAGFRGRTIAGVGAGHRWMREDRWELKLGAGLTYTFQSDVDPDPEDRDRFGGVRLTADFAHDLTASTSLEIKWVVDANAEDRQDVRGELSQSVTAALTDRLALKTTLELLVDNEPPMVRVPLLLPDGTDTGETVRVPLDRVDRVLSVAVVISL